MESTKRPPNTQAMDLLPVETITENEKFYLVRQVANEIARTHNVKDPRELWGAGWLGIERGMRLWDRNRPARPYLRVKVWSAITHSIRARSAR